MQPLVREKLEELRDAAKLNILDHQQIIEMLETRLTDEINLAEPVVASSHGTINVTRPYADEDDV